jgi:hypothetical protein
MRLLEIARQMHVEVLGVGSLPQWANAELLSGVRLMSWVQLPSAIEAAARAFEPGQTQPSVAQPFQAVRAAADRPVPPAQPGKAVLPAQAHDAGNEEPPLDARAPREPFESQGVYESDIATDQSDFDLEGSDLAGTYQQELDPGVGRRPQEQSRDSRPDAAPLPAAPPQPLGSYTVEGSQLLDSAANGENIVAHVSAEDIGKWISGLDEDHAGPERASSVSGQTPAPGATAAPSAAVPPQRGPGASEGWLAPPLPRKIIDESARPLPRALDEPPRGLGQKAFDPHELNGLLTPEELDALLGKDR